MTLDWNSIRPLDGRRDQGFEELCAQLARAEIPPGSTFVRKGTPDAGIECYAVLRDGAEWGWQSKYVDHLGAPQWPQIDGSIRTALQKHPKLVRYFVCAPLDLADARIDGRKSAKDRWTSHVAKWSNWASDRGMSVDFVYWGSHELIDRLTRPIHLGRVRFWFDVHRFDPAWFTARLHEAVATAGPRYTPEIHVDLPIAREFDAFGRTDRFFHQEKARARRIRQKLKATQYSEYTDGPTDSDVSSQLAAVSSKAEQVLAAIGAVTAQPTGPLPFEAISQQILAVNHAAERLSRLLVARERQFDKNAETESQNTKGSPSSYRSNPFRDCRLRLLRLISELQITRDSFLHLGAIADNSLLILRGAAGTGKTHLLCDLAQRRISSGIPTVLLMGQRFVSNEAPWSQALQQLDLSSLSAEEFVGALEAAAQAADSRALLLIDATNEGNGRNIWPSHLAGFLAHLERSPWVGVVLSVRSSFEEIIVPAEVRSRASVAIHSGFSGREYDATKTFFVHYGLELPSTPLLAPEFQNPLFLKTLCRGLKAKGEPRLPRGYQGITAVFDLWLSTVNDRLATSLGFDPRTSLARRALEAFAEATLDSEEPWLTLTKAGEVVNHFLAGREFQRSLYRGLVAEGVLVEEVAHSPAASPDVVVFIGYERFGDHLVASGLLNRYLDVNDPASSFSAEGGLGFVCDERRYVTPGLLEALCIQIPEQTGRELIAVAPICAHRWGLAAAFRQSLIWRTHGAFSEDTHRTLTELSRSEGDRRDTVDVLLTVATLPSHPLNAWYLDRRLRTETMPDRDAWWSADLHHLYGHRGAVDRLLDWASSVDPSTSIENEAVELCAVTLSWMLTTSNRFLRDRATAALVNLLTDRLATVVRLIQRFARVDDPYVVERIYAAAYGVAMRSHDPDAVGTLAASVYDSVFASGSPPPHILLRDYARGVIERALYLESTIDVAVDRVRPPYRSHWPRIPTEEDVKPLLPDWSKGSHDSGELEWARNHIGDSVMEDDFARYVIGTNSSWTNWLSLTLEEPEWEPPARAEDLLRALIDEFSTTERAAWVEFRDEHAARDAAARSLFDDWLAQRERDGTSGSIDFADRESIERGLSAAFPAEVAALEAKRAQASVALELVLSEEHSRRLTEILAAPELDFKARRGPRFDLREIQRYVLWRVFELGWTTERFGRFDRFSVGQNGREASKAERIGKKYQWIAYHEILALVSDRYQYRESLRDEEGDQAYEGPWQGHFRDIDPSCTLRCLPGGTSWDGHAVSWWGSTRYDAWGDPGNPQDWILNTADLPAVEELLVVSDSADRSLWVNGHGFFSWRQQPPADREGADVERREIWYKCTGYLVRADDTATFLQWIEGLDFADRHMPEAASTHYMFLGEHAWSPASYYFQQPYYGDDGWVHLAESCPVQVRNVAREYMREAGGFDCAIDETYTLRLPADDLVAGLGARWSGRGADFVDGEGRLVAQDPTAHSQGPSAMLLRHEPLAKFLAREGLAIGWAVVGEKRAIPPNFRVGSPQPWLRMSGAFVLSKGRAVGFVKRMLDERSAEGGAAARAKVLDIDRTTD